MLIDTHAHLGHRQFVNDIAEVIQRSHAAQVDLLVAPGTDIENSRLLLQLHQTWPELRPALGVHPCDVDGISVTDLNWVSELREMASQPGVAAIGEIGLDYFHAPPEGFTKDAWKAQQHRALELQLDLAAELGLNAIIHTRDSHDDTLEIVKRYSGRVRTVFHCFTGNADQARELADLGHLVSFTGILTFKNSPQIQAAFREIDDGTFMLETDSPFLAPVPYRGKRCEPAYLANIAEFGAWLRDTTPEELAEVTTNTAQRFFRGL